MLDLLSRLDGVRQHSADRGMAKCPAHDDKSASLSWRDAGDRWLLNCFTGCTGLEICNALEIEFRDLFHDRNIKAAHHYHGKQRANPRDALNALADEALVLYVIGRQLERGKPLDENTMNRLADAVRRINDAREAC